MRRTRVDPVQKVPKDVHGGDCDPGSLTSARSPSLTTAVCPLLPACRMQMIESYRPARSTAKAATSAVLSALSSSAAVAGPAPSPGALGPLSVSSSVVDSTAGLEGGDAGSSDGLLVRAVAHGHRVDMWLLRGRPTLTHTRSTHTRTLLLVCAVASNPEGRALLRQSEGEGRGRHACCGRWAR
jgi:hypothetical protein